MGKKFLKWLILGLCLLVFTSALAWLLAPVTAESWQADPNPGLTGVFSRNNMLASVEQIVTPGIGPEAVTCAADGSYWTGLEDGRILRIDIDESVSEIANTGGRPLGMKFDAVGNLIIADAVKGLISVDPGGSVTVLADSHAGVPMLFVDDLDIDNRGRIWFSDASQRYSFDQSMLDFLEGSRAGRLMSYDPVTGETAVHMTGLFFANGVAMGPNKQWLLINETGTGRIHRYWVEGPRAGDSEIFIKELPGTPDNVTFDGIETFWVSMPSLRAALDDLSDKPVLRQIVSALPDSLHSSAATITSFVIGINLNGEVTHNLQDQAGGYHYITSAIACDGELWLGSLAMESVARMPLPITN